MRRNRFACLFIFAALLTSITIPVPQCLAKDTVFNTKTEEAKFSRKQAKPHVTQGANELTNQISPHMASPTIAPPYAWTEATNGTIDPRSYNRLFPNVVPYESTIATPKEESPVIPTLLFASLACSLIFVGVRSIVVKKRAPLFVFGLMAAGALMLVGFMLSFYEPVRMAEAPKMNVLEPVAHAIGDHDKSGNPRPTDGGRIQIPAPSATSRTTAVTFSE